MIIEREVVDNFKSEYLNNPHKSISTISTELGLSKQETSEILNMLRISTKRKTHYIFNESYFKDIDTPNKAYFLGLIAADGFVQNNYFVLSSKDSDILDKFLKEISAEGLSLKRCDGHYANSSECYSVKFSSREFVSHLEKHGIYYKKSLTYSQIPDIPKQFLWDYLRGYIDGDGSVSFKYRKYSIKDREYIYPRLTVSIIATVAFLKEVIKTFEIETYSIIRSKTPEMFYLYISSKKELCRIYPLLYNENSDLYLTRKKDNWDKYIVSLQSEMTVE